MKKITIDQELEHLIPELTEEEYKGLENNIVQNGYDPSFPIIIWNGIIVDGHNRYRICQKHNKEPTYIEKEFGSKEDVINWIIANQLNRRNITKDQRTYLLGKRYIIEKKVVGAPIENKNAEKNNVDKMSTLISPQKTIQKIAKENNISDKTVQRAEIYAKAIDSIALNTNTNPQEILSGKVLLTHKDVENITKLPIEEQKRVIENVKSKPLKDAKQIIKTTILEVRREEKRTELKARPLPEDKFEVIYADPPWTYDHEETENRKISNQYPTMTLDDICTLPIQATDDAILFLWVPMPLIEKGMKVMKAWGFEYKTGMVWVKDKIGMGYYARLRHELLYIGIRGKWSTPDPKDRPDSVIEAPRTEHSVKPSLHDLIEKMYPYRKYIELFARQGDRKNWTYWGNEV
jgi:N6-adenosine-specific RNA methylase IME4